MSIKLIVGLSNPGIQYINTRHNVGSWYIKLLIQYYKQTWKNIKKFYGEISYFYINTKIVYCLIPTVFMNNNGKSILEISKYYNIKPEEILIAHDELDLLPGNIRFKFNGGHNGHNGLKNIISYLNNTRFYRLRIGIGRPAKKSEIIQFVLNKPSEEESELIYVAINRAVCCTSVLILENLLKAIDCLHTTQ